MKILIKSPGIGLKARGGLLILIFILAALFAPSFIKIEFSETKKTSAQTSDIGINNRIKELSSQLKNAADSLNGLSGQMDNLKNQIPSNLTGQYNSLLSQMNDYASQLNNLSGQLNNLSGDFNQITGQITDLSNQLNNITTQLDGLMGQFQNFSNLLTGNLKNLLNNLINQIINQVVEQLSGMIDNLTDLADSISGISSGGSQQETPFGGMRVFTLNCTCSSPNKLLYIQDYASNQLLKLLYVPGTSKIYDHQNPSGATYLLGSYESGGQNCLLRVGKKCINISKDGQLGKKPGTGTSQ